MRIELWHNNETTDPERPWTVSLCDDSGEEEQLLGTRSDFDAAKRSALVHASNRHLDAVYRLKDGSVRPF